MKRKHVDRSIRQLLDRIDGELAEVRDGLIQVDERSARHQARITDLEARLQEHVTTYDRFAHPAHPVPDGFSVKAS